MIRWLDQCKNTQDRLNTEPQSTTAIATLEQTHGRGRQGKRWVSPAQTSLALSWRAPTKGLEVQDLPLISLAVGVGLYQWLNRQDDGRDTSLRSQLCLKWPNDLLLEGRKLAGILCEGRIIGTQQEVIVGLGINLSLHHQLPLNSAALEELHADFSASSLREVGVPTLISDLNHAVQRLISDRQLLLAEWRLRSLPLGTQLRAAGHVGVYRGINERGALLLDLGERSITVESGEVDLLGSLRLPTPIS